MLRIVEWIRSRIEATLNSFKGGRPIYPDLGSLLEMVTVLDLVVFLVGVGVILLVLIASNGKGDDK